MKRRSSIPESLRHALVPLLLGLAGPVAHSHAAPAISELRAPDGAAARRIAGIIAAASHRHRVDEALIHAIVLVESSYDAEAVSSQGALGLMQLMPATIERYGVRDPFDPAENIEAGVRFLKELLDLFDGDVALAIAGYNSGANAVIRAGHRIPENAETLAFVPRVLGHYAERQAAARSPASADEPLRMVAAREAVPLFPAADPAPDPLPDLGTPPAEREKRPVGIVSARRSSRWRLGRVRFSGAASSPYSSLPEAPKERAPKTGKLRRTVRAGLARPAPGRTRKRSG